MTFSHNDCLVFFSNDFDIQCRPHFSNLPAFFGIYSSRNRWSGGNWRISLLRPVTDPDVLVWHTTQGIVSIVLVFCFSIGYFVGFEFEWTKADAWGIKNVMLVWTARIVINVMFNGSMIISIPRIVM